MKEAMDDLLATLAVSPDGCGSSTDMGMDQHPRFGDYKNEGKVAEQQRLRREEHKQRGKNKQEDWLDRRRNIMALAEDPVQENPFAMRRRQDRDKNKEKPKPYANMLMQSDWLVDIPEASELSQEWTLVASPKGRRCLVVAKGGKTEVYNKFGGQLSFFKFTTPLPGGNVSWGKGTDSVTKADDALTMLDCICTSRGKQLGKGEHYYVLDMISWGGSMYTDQEFTQRQAVLRTNLEQMALDGDTNADKFIMLPSCPCSPEAVTKFMEMDFPYQLDGLLFYYNHGHYIPEQTPLVGWLKPWMLPEILGVPVPEKYTKNVKFENSKAFIDNFNAAHGHCSSAQKKEKAAAIQSEMQNPNDANKNDFGDDNVQQMELAEAEGNEKK